MSIVTGKDNVIRQVTAVYVGVGGVVRTVTEGYCGRENVVRQFLGAAAASDLADTDDTPQAFEQTDL